MIFLKKKKNIIINFFANSSCKLKDDSYTVISYINMGWKVYEIVGKVYEIVANRW